MNHSCILIDWDDTLWDFKANSLTALRKTYEQQQLSQHFSSFDHFHQLYEDINIQLWEQYEQKEITKDFLSIERFHQPLRTVGHDNIELAKTLSPLYLHLTTLQTSLIDGAHNLLKHLAQTHRIVIISNGFSQVQYPKINNSPLAPYISDIILSEEVGAQKPHPDFFTHTLQKINEQKENCIVIGDRYEADIIGAINYGIDCIHYNPLKTPHPKHPHLIASVTSLLQIPQILLN